MPHAHHAHHEVPVQLLNKWPLSCKILTKVNVDEIEVAQENYPPSLAPVAIPAFSTQLHAQQFDTVPVCVFGICRYKCAFICGYNRNLRYGYTIIWKEQYGELSSTLSDHFRSGSHFLFNTLVCTLDPYISVAQPFAAAQTIHSCIVLALTDRPKFNSME